MRLDYLRTQAPDWNWRGERSGFGWSYVGQKGGQTVRVCAYAVLSGFSDDDFCIQWRVSANEWSVTLGMWLLRNRVSAAPTSTTPQTPEESENLRPVQSQQSHGNDDRKAQDTQHPSSTGRREPSEGT